MMKRFLSLLLCAMLLLPGCAGAAVRVESKMRIATRSGPGTDYTELGSYYQAGYEVTAISRAYDSRNGIWWIQVEFTYQKELIRVYTGHKRLDMSLYAVPEEGSLGWYTVTGDAYAWYGPGSDYKMQDFLIPGGTTGEIITEENGFVQFEYTDHSRSLKRRVWLWSGDLKGFSYTTGSSDPWGNGGYAGSWYNEEQPRQWTSPAINDAVYARGDTHLIILWVQAQLKNMGYYVARNAFGEDDAELTGYLDVQTESAIRTFQADHGLTGSGQVSQTLVNAIMYRQLYGGAVQYPVYVGGYYTVLDGLFQTPLYPGEIRSREIRILQTMLDAIGYDVGGIDGAFGSRTLQAFHAWQDDFGFCRTQMVTLGHVRELLTTYVGSGYRSADLP